MKYAERMLMINYIDHKPAMLMFDVGVTMRPSLYQVYRAVGAPPPPICPQPFPGDSPSPTSQWNSALPPTSATATGGRTCTQADTDLVSRTCKK